jgi:predicted nucleotidyltransferase
MPGSPGVTLRGVLTDDVLDELANDLCGIAGVHAVALGGSRARGTHRPDSDFDLGIYYDGELDLIGLEHLAAHWAGAPVPVAAPGAWGPWVNGGAWLTIDGGPVDWILRERRRVDEQCERARRGEFAFHVQAGHPLGFLDVSYAGEVATGMPLRDDDSILADLTARVSPYPDALRSAMIANLWQVDFLLDGAEKGAKAADVAYVTQCLGTAAMLIAHGWHALAGEWVTNEKGLVPRVARLAVDTHGFSDVVASALGGVGQGTVELQQSIAAMRAAPRPGID